jgi:hypothetical protein
MAVMYAKTAGGNWSAAGTWSATGAGGVDNAGPPAATTDVIFELLSGNVVIDAASSARSIDMTSGTGNYAGVLNHDAGFILTIGDGTSGAGNVAIKFVAGTYTKDNTQTSATTFASTNGTAQTITLAGNTLGNTIFNGAGGSWQFADAFALGTNGGLTLTAGTLNTNAQTMSTYAFTTSGSTTRALNITNTTWTTLGGNIQFALLTNLTFTYTGSTIIFAGSSGNHTLAGLTFNIFNVTGGGTNTFTSTSTTTATTMTVTAPATKVGTIAMAGNFTITGTLTINGNSVTNRELVQSSVRGTAITISAGTIVTKWTDWQDITSAGAANWDLTAQATDSSGDCGGNTGITFTTAANQTSTGTASFSWSTHGWTTRVPLPQDDVFISNAFTSARVVTMDMPRAGKTIDWSATTWSGTAPTWTKSTASSIFGSVIMITNGLNSGTSTITFEGRGAFTITSAGQTWTNPFTFNSPASGGGSIKFLDAFSNNNVALSHLNGTLDFNNFSVSVGSYSNSGTNTRVLTLGNATTTITSAGGGGFSGTGAGYTVTTTTGTVKFTDTTAGSRARFAGAGKTYGNLWFARGAGTGDNEISGSNTFTDLKDTGTVAHNLYFTTATTTTVTTFTVTGSSGNVITINTSNGSGTPATTTHALVKAGGGTISSDWLNIQHSVATPATTWYAGANSVNNQAVATAGSGWIFTVPPTGGNTSSMFLLFGV